MFRTKVEHGGGTMEEGGGGQGEWQMGPGWWGGGQRLGTTLPSLPLSSMSSDIFLSSQKVLHFVQDEDGAMADWGVGGGGAPWVVEMRLGGRGMGEQVQRLCVTSPSSSFIVVKLTSLMVPRKFSTVSRMKIELWQTGEAGVGGGSWVCVWRGSWGGGGNESGI